MQVSAAVDDYLETLRCTRRPRTLESAIQILNEFGAQFGSRKLTDLKRRDLLQYLKSLGKAGNSPRTQANKFVRIVAMLRHHEITITKKGDRPRFTKPMPQVYESADLETFFAACNPRQQVFFRTLLMTGIRKEEARWLEWGDLQNGMIHLHAHPPNFVPKTHEERRIPVPSALWKMLANMKRRPGRLVFPTKSGAPDRHMLRHCKRIAARAGLNAEEWTLHKFRKTYCTDLLRSGMDIRTVMSLMGHSSITTTMRYLRPIEAEQLRGALDNVWRQAPADPEPNPEPKATRSLPTVPAAVNPLPPILAIPEDFTDGVIFYQEPEPPKRPTGDGTELRDLLPPPDFEIVRGIVETGGAYAQIARNLNIAPQSLKNRVSAILSKTGCSSRLELATRYCRENLAEVRAAAGMQSGV